MFTLCHSILYYKRKQGFMDAEKIQEKIKEIEQEIKSLPYHKGTEHHIGKLRAKLAKLRAEIIKTKSRKTAASSFAVKKQGDATVVLIGLPSVGKSTLLNKLTGSKSKVGHYPFTTLDVIPGSLHYQGAQIQIFDVPGLISGAAGGKGGGKEILSVVRVTDLLVLIASAQEPKTFGLMEKELELAGVRINQEKPGIFIEKRLKHGIEILGNPGLSPQTIKSLAQEFKMPNAKITFKKKVSQDELIDALMGNRVYAPGIKVISKTDLLSPKEEKKLLEKFKDCLFISSKKNLGLEQLKEKIFQELNIIRVYLRQTLRAKPEKKPLICKKETTVLEAARKISQDLAQEIKGAKIKGSSARHLNQFVGPNHKLQDQDQIFFVK